MAAKKKQSGPRELKTAQQQTRQHVTNVACHVSGNAVGAWGPHIKRSLIFLLSLADLLSLYTSRNMSLTDRPFYRAFQCREKSDLEASTRCQILIISEVVLA